MPARAARLAAREVEVFVDHMLHLVQVAAHGVLTLEGRRQRELQPQARERRAQVVAHRGQHGRALVDMALDAAAHFQEGVRGLAHLARTGGLEPVGVLAAAELFGGVGQPADRLHLVADEDDGYQRQYSGRAVDEDWRCPFRPRRSEAGAADVR